MSSAVAIRPSPQVIRTRGLRRVFGGRAALDGLDLDVPGGVVGLLGPNGAGKTTLLRLVLGLDAADGGTAEVLGEPMPARALAVRSRVGFMPEDDCLFPRLRGIEQVVHAGRLCGLSQRDAQARAHHALDLVGLGDRRHVAARLYSTGERQRLRLAMAVVHGPELLLLDEPTAGLDPDGRAQMLDAIAVVGEAGAAVLLSTHVLPDVEAVAEHVVMLRGGHLAWSGSVRAFRGGVGAPTLVVDLVGEAGPLVAALRAAGLPADADPNDPRRLRLPDDPAHRSAVWRVAAQLGDVGIVGFGPEQMQMADAFAARMEAA